MNSPNVEKEIDLQTQRLRETRGEPLHSASQSRCHRYKAETRYRKLSEETTNSPTKVEILGPLSSTWNSVFQALKTTPNQVCCIQQAHLLKLRAKERHLHHHKPRQTMITEPGLQRILEKNTKQRQECFNYESTRCFRGGIVKKRRARKESTISNTVNLIVIGERVKNKQQSSQPEKQPTKLQELENISLYKTKM